MLPWHTAVQDDLQNLKMEEAGTWDEIAKLTRTWKRPPPPLRHDFVRFFPSFQTVIFSQKERTVSDFTCYFTPGGLDHNALPKDFQMCPKCKTKKPTGSAVPSTSGITLQLLYSQSSNKCEYQLRL